MSAMFKTIADPPDIELTLSIDTANELEVRRKALSDLLGFEVTAPQTVAHLLRHARPLPDTMSSHGTEWAPAYRKSPIESFLPAVGTTKRDAIEADVVRLLAAGKKIEAIKLVREQVPVGLKEAKEYVDLFPGGEPRPSRF